MYNLITLKIKNIVLNNENKEKINVSNISFDSSSQSTFICTINETSRFILIHKDDENVSLVCCKEVSCDLSTLLETEILDFQFLSEIRSCCLIMKNGDIVLIHNDSSITEEQVEIVGSVDGGIVAAKWAPDETVLAICTGEAKFLLMSQNFETISEIPLLESDINISNHVSVGWGRAETQFQGKRSKIPRDPTIPEKIDKGLLSDYDDKLTRLSWREDGTFVSLSRIDAEARRIIRVFARNGILDSVSQPVDYLESLLAWKPSGSVIASIQRKPKELDVIFFERNGLRHGEFSLKSSLSSEESILDIQWNSDSSLLSILVPNKIQLWYMSNYHWHLKYEIKFKSSKNIFIKWHPEIPLILSLINDGDLVLYYFTWTIISSPLNLSYDYGTVAVINGDNLRLTPFKIANVPPPLSFRDIKLSETPTSISISKDSNYILSLTDNMIEVIHWPLNIDSSAFPEIINKLDISFEPKIALIDLGVYEKSIVVDDNGKLFANDRLISTNCTSFICSKEYLVFTSSNLAKFVKLTPNVEDFVIPSDNVTNIEVRSIEKGAKIISIIPSITALIFQMPRGNIETIYPRILVLSKIYESIRLKNYSHAFLSCRTHRIDTNILYDYNPSQFLDNVHLFVNQLDNSEYLNLFLSTLKEEDLVKTLYNLELKKESDMTSEKKILSPKFSKVNTICDHILKVLKVCFDNKYIESILTAYLSKIPEDYDSALKLIIDLKNTNLNDAQKAIKYICILADVNMLYDHALSLYDLQLALHIAQNSQKDPKEYLPFLQDLQKQTVNRRYFIIDDYLKKYEKALAHLIKLGNDVFDEVCNYVVLHSLYREAMKAFKNDPVRYNKILELYAAYHEKNNHFKESALAYEILNNYEYAIIMYKKAGLWRKALTLAMKFKISNDDMNKLAESLSSIMQDKRKFCDAADIEIYYLKNLKEGLRLLCKNFDYNKAYELNNEDIPDDVSLADTNTSISSSIFTQYSKYTTTINTSGKKDKVYRQEERKKARKQKGSIWEEEYLLNSITRLIGRLEDARQDAEKTIQGLLLERLSEKASLLQKQMTCLVEDVKECLEEMFSHTIENSSGNIQNNIRIPPIIRPINELKILV
ncbi:hypothetical protein PMAC_000745 [Pneumocystis sp. 'macacae']|nr:hypothetical protein PMAC_000745 [Pneumocystis sp. 'macacae']